MDERYRAVEDAVWAQLDVLLAELHERELGQGELMPYGPLCAELIQRVEHRSFVLENRALARMILPLRTGQRGGCAWVGRSGCGQTSASTACGPGCAGRRPVRAWRGSRSPRGDGREFGPQD